MKTYRIKRDLENMMLGKIKPDLKVLVCDMVQIIYIIEDLEEKINKIGVPNEK